MCPPGVDQTTRMTQKWSILAPRLRQINRFPETPSFEKFSLDDESHENDDGITWDAWSKLARMTPTIHSHGVGLYRTRRMASVKPSKLESMPTELIGMVLGDSELEREDVMAIGLCSDILWLHVLRHIEKDSQKNIAPWAGTELACTGTYLTDLPPSFEKDNLAESSVAFSTYGRMCRARKINYAADKSYTQPAGDPEQAWQSAFDAKIAIMSTIPSTQVKYLKQDLLSVCSRLPPNSLDAPWILRNLSTREYIRCRPGAGVGGQRGFVEHPDTKWLRLDDALLMRIYWTYEHVDLCRGKWAGHCFDIIPLEDKGGNVGDGWVDVTGGLVKDGEKLRLKMQRNKADQSPRLALFQSFLPIR